MDTHSLELIATGSWLYDFASYKKSPINNFACDSSILVSFWLPRGVKHNGKQKKIISEQTQFGVFSSSSSLASYLNKLPACDRYVGGGDAPRTAPACLSRSNSSNLKGNNK